MTSNISERFERLKEIRETLCKKNEKWNEVFDLRDWLINNLKEVIAQSKSDLVKKEDIINKLEDLICVVEPEEYDDK